VRDAMEPRFTLRRGHAEEDHDHVLFAGREVVRFDYGEDGDTTARSVKRLVRAANRALALRERRP
jgi:hypothetical protein